MEINPVEWFCSSKTHAGKESMAEQATRYKSWWQRSDLVVRYATQDLYDGLQVEKKQRYKRIPAPRWSPVCVTVLWTHCNSRQIKDNWKLTVCTGAWEYKFSGVTCALQVVLHLFANANLPLGHKCVLGVGFALGCQRYPAHLWQTFTHSAT